MGTAPQEAFAPVTHRSPMLSLVSGYGEKDITDFDTRLRDTIGKDDPFNYTVEPKIDGPAVEMVYEEGALIVASTRGDGFVGEDITPNIKTILTVPLNLMPPRDGSSIPEFLEVRGVVYMETEVFGEHLRVVLRVDADAHGVLRAKVSGRDLQCLFRVVPTGGEDFVVDHWP